MHLNMTKLNQTPEMNVPITYVGVGPFRDIKFGNTLFGEGVISHETQLLGYNLLELNRADLSKISKQLPDFDDSYRTYALHPSPSSEDYVDVRVYQINGLEYRKALNFDNMSSYLNPN